jgi:hypothetical protein
MWHDALKVRVRFAETRVKESKMIYHLFGVGLEKT